MNANQTPAPVSTCTPRAHAPRPRMFLHTACSYTPPSSCVQEVRCTPGFIPFAICLAVAAVHASKQRTPLIYASRPASVVASDPSLGKHNGELLVQCRASDAVMEVVSLPLAHPAHAPGPDGPDTTTPYASHAARLSCRPCMHAYTPHPQLPALTLMQLVLVLPCIPA